MSFNWTEYLNLAKKLAGQECAVDPEAAKRAAVSRAYYAAYCTARIFAIRKLGFKPSNDDSSDHGRLPVHLKKHGKSPRASEYLKDLRVWRNYCDYDQDYKVEDAMVTQAITLAQNIVNWLKT